MNHIHHIEFINEVIIQNSNKDLIALSITSLFKNGELGSALTQILKEKYGLISDTEKIDIKNNIDKDVIYKKVREHLHIDESINPIVGKEEKEDIVNLLKSINVLVDAEKLVNGQVEKVQIFNQPGLRFNQVTQLIDVLQNDIGFNTLTLKEQKLLKDKIIKDVEGHLIEHIVIVECSKFSNDNLFVRQITDKIGEWDLAIYGVDKFNIYEIKLSSEIVEEQAKWLVNNQMKQLYEQLFNKSIQKRIVLYRGDTEISKTITFPKDSTNTETVEYKNIDNFLLNLSAELV